MGPNGGEQSSGAFAPPTGLPAPVPAPPLVAPRASSGNGRRWLAAGIGAVVVAAAIIAMNTAGKDGGPAYPEDWDPRLADLVQFVQDERGLLYDHPVPVDFLTAEEYSKRVGDSDELTDEEIEQIEHFEAELRAVGLVTGDVDLVGSLGTLHDEGTLAFYDPETERVTVRGTEITTDVRVTLVHELTHVLQDQHFDLQGLDQPDASSDAEGGFRALVEGDATRIENRYIDSLDDDDRRAYEQAEEEQQAGADDDLADVPPVLRTYFGAPYVLGTDLVDLLEQTGGDKAINGAFDTPPDSEAVLLDPFRFLDHDAATDVAVPALEAGEEKIEDGDMGAIALFLMLASRLDAHDALDGVDVWDGDSFVGFERDGRTCVRTTIATVDASGAGRLDQLLTEWSSAVPDASAKVRRDDATVTFESCDPGIDASSSASDLGDTALALPVIRTEIALEVVRGGGAPDLARCLSAQIVDEFTVEELIAADPARFQSDDFFQHVEAFAQKCPGG